MVFQNWKTGSSLGTELLRNFIMQEALQFNKVTEKKTDFTTAKPKALEMELFIFLQITN